MQKELLDTAIQNFIEESLTGNFSKIALQKNPFPEVAWNSILTQIGSKIKAKEKLPTWFQTTQILYPPKISIEQTSSECTAKYKASLVEGNSLIDLTGGFGVDAYFFAKKVNKVTHCEVNSELSAIVAHNFAMLGTKNITCIAKDSTSFLNSANAIFDWIYIDPSRRNDKKGKVFLLEDCLPNVPENLSLYFQYTNNILIKTAPILDISAGLQELNYVKEIHVVALQNEVKELLWILKKDYSGPISVKTINIPNAEVIEEVSFTYPYTETNPYYSFPKKYLYEPNNAILKAGAFNSISSLYPVEKLEQHSHLYTSDNCIDFPGRRFIIQSVLEYSKEAMKKNLEKVKANITTRNFPESVEIIRKKWKIKDGGDLYVFFTTDKNKNKIVLLCNKI